MALPRQTHFFSPGNFAESFVLTQLTVLSPRFVEIAQFQNLYGEVHVTAIQNNGDIYEHAICVR